ncbi:MAG: hypothetical protein OFPI_31050 [Osedax symbiont Rs2]|nr:MAG: hypothetical protein OFPI_31050 [Osedax symbiont Rs2]
MGLVANWLVSGWLNTGCWKGQAEVEAQSGDFIHRSLNSGSC